METSKQIFTIIKYQKKILNLLVVLIDSVFRTGKNFDPQVFLEECKYVVRGKKISKYIIDNVKISSDTDRENSDEENSNKE